MKLPWVVAGLCLAALGPIGPAWAQVASGDAALDEAMRLGTTATLAPLCALRDEDWSFDLRRAAILAATKAPRPDDAALRDAPGSAVVTGALSFAEAEALESFAEAPAPETCGPLAAGTDLARADAIVRAFRALKEKPSS